MLPVGGVNLNPLRNMFQRTALRESLSPISASAGRTTLANAKVLSSNDNRKSLSKGDSVAADDAGSR